MCLVALRAWVRASRERVAYGQRWAGRTVGKEVLEEGGVESLLARRVVAPVPARAVDPADADDPRRRAVCERPGLVAHRGEDHLRRGGLLMVMRTRHPCRTNGHLYDILAEGAFYSKRRCAERA